jgi:hypothetical protein
VSSTIEPPEPDEQLTPDQSALADSLTRERPVPPAGFRGALARYLAAHDPGYGPRPPRLRTTATVLVLVGLLLVLLGLLQAVGSL